MKHFPQHVGGMEVSQWIDLFEGCHRKNGKDSVQWSWPDGECYLKQDNLTIVMFELIRAQLGDN